VAADRIVEPIVFISTEIYNRPMGLSGSALPPPSPDGPPNGGWLWTGTTWIASPTVSLAPSTNRYGKSWRIAPVLRSLAVGATLWLMLLGAWMPVLIALAHTGPLTTNGRQIAVSLGCVSVVSTIVFGVVLGRKRRLAEVVVGAVLGTTVLLTWYVVAMLADPHPDGTEDTAAGAGLVIFSVPTFLVVFILLVTGFAARRTLGMVASKRAATKPR
jgi:hypothetical protein